MPTDLEDSIRLYRAGRLREALAHCEQRLRAGGDDVMTLTLTGTILGQLDQLELALPLLERALAIDPGRILALVNAAKALDTLGRHAEAASLLERLLAADPQNVPALIDHGLALTRARRVGAGERQLRRAVALAPESADARLGLGFCLEQRGRVFEAEAGYRAAMALRPDWEKAPVALGILLLSQHRLDEAEALFRRALELQPRFAPAHAALGEVLALRECRDEAADCCRQALALRPAYAVPYARLCDLDQPPSRGAEPDGGGRTLVIVWHEGAQDRGDFVDIAGRIAARAPGIAVHLVTPWDSDAAVPDDAWRRPTLTVSLGPLGRFCPRHGMVRRCREISKIEQYERFTRAGIRTPSTQRFEFGRHYDERDWGEFVVLKPMASALQSVDTAFLFRTRRIDRLRPEDLDPAHLAHRTPMLIQSFVDTGDHLSKIRALTLMGRLIYQRTLVLKATRVDLGADDATIEAAKISDFNGDRDNDNTPYADVATMAVEIAACFPEIPLLGIDLLRSAVDGRLYALEINAGGNVWHFSSRIFADQRAKYPELVAAMHAQYGAFDVAAQALIDAVETLAI